MHNNSYKNKYTPPHLRRGRGRGGSLQNSGHGQNSANIPHTSRNTAPYQNRHLNTVEQDNLHNRNIDAHHRSRDNESFFDNFASNSTNTGNRFTNNRNNNGKNNNYQPRTNYNSTGNYENSSNSVPPWDKSNFRGNNFWQTKNILKDMLNEDNIALKLLDPKLRMKNFLANTTNQDCDTCILIMELILKASESRLMESNFREFLGLVLNSNFSKERLDRLINVDLVSNMDSKIIRLIILFMKLSFTILPGIAYDILYLRFNNIGMIMDNFRLKSNIINEDIDHELEELKIIVESSSSNSKVERKMMRRKFIGDDLDPPNDFREISIFPVQEDLEIKSSEVFLRRNRDNGIYKSVDDYLDVQFRLMREDFIQPLRQGLAHLKNDPGKKNFDVRIYNKVSMVNCLPVERLGIVYNISFDISRLKKVKWVQSKRFLYGSFICLMEDNSKKFIFATVANRTIKDLEKGMITVKFHNGNPIANVEYILIETTNMFESYRHVLLKLQETNAENLCLARYLVFANEDILLPEYLKRNKQLRFNFFGMNFFPGIETSKWPRAIDFEFDESQFRAFKTSLTKEIAIIQGPPGTGKTYLGLKICKCLLENVQTNIPNFGPILIVCYTNHALDQFLEGILAFTRRIVRIGSRSSSELLQDYILINWKKKENLRNHSQRRRQILSSMESIKEGLLKTQAYLKMSHESLININRLRVFMSHEHFNYLDHFGTEQWLNGEMMEYGFSDQEHQLDNMIEWLIYEEINTNIFEIIKEVWIEFENEVDDEYIDDKDVEVNYINNQRQLDIDNDDISKTNTEFERIIGGMRTITFDEEILPMNDGFIRVKSKVSKKMFKNRLRIKDKMTPEEVSRVITLDSLTLKDRWRLYHYWLSMYDEELIEESKKLENQFEDLSKQLVELSYDDDRMIMMKQDVIGMTTTGAARYSRVLEEIKCKIIIVEEAAEVLESHIIGSLNSSCEHLILIGDHKQLKPNPAVYELAKDYQLDLSLFERLINNGLHYNTLELQHRMRPEIAEIMKYIYENLKNHESVFKYPNIPGVSKNIYFFNHTKLETHDNESSSYSNKFEAEFIVSFCRHLMKNGIEKQKITILTLYSGQLFVLRKLMPKHIFEGIRVCVVDNFQGEENDIIILSLVRSNDEEKIGFLNIENRVCVSLSRAKMGLYVFGNFQLLAYKSKLWREISHDLRNKQLLGDTLTLRCENHPDKKLEIQNPEDFIKYPEGGCDQICNERLECGHACRKCCHFLDKNHLQVKCLEKCPKRCKNGHPCKMKCWQECSNCRVAVPKLLPLCGHTQMMSCFKEPEPDCCHNECNRVLICGHKCMSECREKCGKCLTKVKKMSAECGHVGEYYCHDEILVCTKKCTEILGCEHACFGTCGKCNFGRLHVGCKDKCSNQLICGHICKERCSRDCPPCNEECEEGCFHNRCTKSCNDKCIPCHEKCKWKCEHKQCTMKCNQQCDRDVCDERCKIILKCTKCESKFQCYGVCGEKCRSICLKCDPEVTEIFFGTEDKEGAKFITLWTCGHSFECESMDTYMNTAPDNDEIVPKRCPRCKSIINKRSCFRYLNIVKKISQDVKNIQSLIRKNKQTSSFTKLVKKSEALSQKISRIFEMHQLECYFSIISKNEKPFSDHETAKYETSLELVHKIYNDIFLKLVEMNRTLDINYKYIENSIKSLLEWLNPKKRKFNNFEINQYNAEIERIGFIIRISNIRKTHPFVRKYDEFIDELKLCKSFSGEFAENFRLRLKEFDYIPNTAITEKERKEIVEAIGLGKGRWFKCPQGHYYVIGECGGANQISKCLECNSKVGGEQHRILNDNQFAPEMDDAHYPAFSELANIENFPNLMEFQD